MTNKYQSLHFFTLTLIALVALLSPTAAGAFSPDKYASESVLATGKWVKIRVPSTGLYAIPVADLHRWGFNDPKKVRIHGYGGGRINELLSSENYIDDLPLLQSAVTDRGIVFWASGPESWEYASDVWTHSLNPYSTAGYYFVTESDSPARDIESENFDIPTGAEFATTFTEHLFHETEKVSPYTLGLTLFGEDFRFTPTQDFRFATPGAVPGDGNATVRVNFMAAAGGASTLSVTASGKSLTGLTGHIFPPSSEGSISLASGRTQGPGDNLSVGLRFQSSGTVNMAYLDYIEVEYLRETTLKGGLLVFSSASPAIQVATAGASDVRVWDVTSPLTIRAMHTTNTASSAVRFATPYSGLRTYCAWSPSAVLPAPTLVGTVENQDIHSRRTPDMIIVATEENMIQAERIADLHRNGPDNLDVFVVHQSKVYNEFGSGCADPGAIRKMAKMFYDRSATATDGGNFRYLLLMGRPTFDNRRLTSSMSTTTYETLPGWTTDVSINENIAYCSDDYFAMLEDNSGLRWGNENLLIAVGRIPSTSNADAKIFVDRLIDYSTKPAGEWATRVLMTADDGDASVHLLQSESMMSGFRTSDGGDNLNYKKIYFGAYTLSNGIYGDAVSSFRRQLDDGVLWWNYIGHASIDNLTGEGLLTTSDLYQLYLRKPLIFYGATCSFARWDGARMSGAEALCLRESGGAVAAISAVRPVYISLNGPLSDALSRQIFTRDSEGRLPTLGDALRKAKNALKSDTNKRRYVLLGDPAMRLAIPDNKVEITAVNGRNATAADEPPVISALQNVTVSGVITAPDGSRLTDFNGTLSYTIYDAEYSVISNELDEYDREVSFEQQGERVAAGRARISDGAFEISFTMPSEISDNYRPGAMTLFAVDENGSQASACFRNFYLFGTDDTATADNLPPAIEYMHLNHESFTDGDAVNNTPMLIARVSDDTGINLSTAGVGHQMSVRIDGKISCNDVASSFTPDDDGSVAGTIAYRLPSLMPGEHTAELKIWDVSGNSTTSSLMFTIDESLTPSIFDVYTDANPAITEANFYVTHNRPDEILNVTIEVFDFNGKLVWSDTSTGRADLYSSAPVRWNLTTTSGGRANRGIYIYRARIAPASNPDAVSASKSRRLAVAGH